MGRLRATLAPAIVSLAFCSAAAADVDYGTLSKKGLKKVGKADPSLKLHLQIGYKADNSGVQDAAKAASNPSSSKYGKYLSLSDLAGRYGASKNKRKAVKKAFKQYGVEPKVDVTKLRADAKISIKKAQKLFGVTWKLYATGSGNQYIAMPGDTPKPPKGIKKNVNVIAGVRLNVTGRQTASVSAATPRPRARIAAVNGGTPTRTGTISAGCAETEFPSAVRSSSGLFPNQILAAYGISPLHDAGLLGQSRRVAVVGEAPARSGDYNTFRSCFGFPGTALTNHNGSGITPILESSLDVQTVAMVAPQLARLDLWVNPISENEDDGDVAGFLKLLAAPLQATANGAKLPHVISVSYGVCETQIKPFTAARKLADRQLAATAALGITTVVAAGDSGSSSCAHGVKTDQLTSADKAQSALWPATSEWVLAVGGTNLTLTAQNAIESSGVWNDTAYPEPYTLTAGGGGGVSLFESRPSWQPPLPSQSKHRMVPDVAAFADALPGYAIVCSQGVQGCGAAAGQSIVAVGGTSAATPLVAGMIALWSQEAKQAGLPEPGFVPPLLYSIAQRTPGAFLDITLGNNSVFGSVSCCSAGPGFDLASGLGSPFANAIVEQLHP